MYLLITPARNEGKYINYTIEAVLSQDLKPICWIIVDDGSTDDTNLIIRRLSKNYSWVWVVERNSVQERGFASKALAFMEGYKMVSELSYSYIGNLDADVSFNASYYRILIEKMENNKRLGVASGVILEKSFKGYQRVTSSLNHAVGAVQFWKRECFEQVGGYRPVTVSGIDAISELIARMKGWETRSFQDLHVYHHRPVDTSNTKSALERAYRAGLTEYHIGTSSCFALFKAIRRWRERPIILSAFIRLLAYWAAWVKKIPRDAPDELIEYLKREQKYRLKAALKGQFDWR